MIRFRRRRRAECAPEARDAIARFTAEHSLRAEIHRGVRIERAHEELGVSLRFDLAFDPKRGCNGRRLPLRRLGEYGEGAKQFVHAYGTVESLNASGGGLSGRSIQ